MLTGLKKIKTRLAADERGSVSVEAVLMFPMLVWAYMAMYVFYEGLRETNINLKATYTIADYLTRTPDALTKQDAEALGNIYEWLTNAIYPVNVRITVVTYDQATNSHKYWCSEETTGVPALTQEQIPAVISPHVPIMADQGEAIVVETWSVYTPVLDYIPLMGGVLSESQIYNIVVTQHRDAGLTCDHANQGSGSAHDDGTGGAVDDV